MPTIISYRKYIDLEITRELRLPADGQHQTLGTELATLADGTTYVVLPDGATLPADQPAEIAASIQTVVTLDAVTREAIRAASPHVQLINRRVAEKIAEKYSIVDEIRLLRTLPSADFDIYNSHAEACRAQGRTEKALLGLAEVVEVPLAVTMRQARIALLQAGLLAQINTAIAAMTGPTGDAARVVWEFSSEVRRDNQLLETMATSLGLTSAQLDQLFITASGL